jgi:hypothetical protein
MALYMVPVNKINIYSYLYCNCYRDSPLFSTACLRPADGARIIHVPAGPPSSVRKEELLPFMGDSAAAGGGGAMT